MSDTKFIKIKNWEKFQHYTDRNPPWIKLYHSLLDDYHYGCLQDDSKLLLTTLYLLASRSGNKIPADPTWIKRRGNLNHTPNLKPLLEADFIEYDGELQNDSTLQANNKQNGVTETESETESDSSSTGASGKDGKKQKNSKRITFPWEKIAEVWNDFLDDLDNGSRIRHHRADYISQDRRRQVRKYWKEWKRYDPNDDPWETFKDIMREIAKSEGLQEKNKALQRSGIFWLCRKGAKDNQPNWEKTINGQYRDWDNKDEWA